MPDAGPHRISPALAHHLTHRLEPPVDLCWWPVCADVVAAGPHQDLDRIIELPSPPAPAPPSRATATARVILEAYRLDHVIDWS